ncbi:uncharacterized protein TM35_000102150 [Trypanosoma theileri]|uniref:Uncharacterized protein n=1 Tax=Trypanosoma theileri TaxID=67003 RepID=A0A1X0NZ26_9TRYP|nr:uncharacterized protein TM35_000102150 [Trypanosoma theileri]ORC89947.1 hypothetical protein TM35_000102150 [Trypanosoma theileri]
MIQSWTNYQLNRVNYVIVKNLLIYFSSSQSAKRKFLKKISLQTRAQTIYDCSRKQGHISVPNGQQWKKQNQCYTISTNAHERNYRMKSLGDSKVQITRSRNYKTEWHIFTRKT